MCIQEKARCPCHERPYEIGPEIPEVRKFCEDIGYKEIYQQTNSTYHTETEELECSRISDGLRNNEAANPAQKVLFPSLRVISHKP